MFIATTLSVSDTTNNHNGWTVTVKACIKGHNNKSVGNVATLSACAALCAEETSCKSIDYNMVTLACHQSSEVQASVGADYNQPCYGYPGQWNYMEKISGKTSFYHREINFHCHNSICFRYNKQPQWLDGVSERMHQGSQQ
jgi:hypothetical protein